MCAGPEAAALPGPLHLVWAVSAYMPRPWLVYLPGLQLQGLQLDQACSYPELIHSQASSSCALSWASSSPGTPGRTQHPRRVCRFFALKHGNAMFHEGGTIGKRVTWSSNDEHLRRWKEGKTGLPLVDANMRELAQTGGSLNKSFSTVSATAFSRIREVFT